jgi:hypothetical protein
MPGFRRRGPEIDLDLPEEEMGLLAYALPLLEGVGADDPSDPAGARLRFRAHPGDADAEAHFQELTAGSLEADRAEDRRRFAASLERGTLSIDDASAWLRVLTEARLVLGARLGITDEGWERDDEESEVGMALLRLYSGVQDDLTGLLLRPGRGRR